MPVVSMRSAVCLLGRFPALAGADLDVDEGDILLLSGPNGAGKTTLLRCVAGLVPLHSGTAFVFGHDLAFDRRTARHELALVGHETFCYDDLTVRENLRFAAAAARRPNAAADAALERLDLGRVADIAHSRLSAGQRRRLSLAVALAREARLLLLDEPHAGLDPTTRETLDAILLGAASEGRTVVLASHELVYARAIATREARVVAGLVQGGLAPATTKPEPKPLEVRA
ncbi:MAG: heme exporter, ATP-binding protein CcmA [Actinomycetia bacterium]|nr:heme exporter, ATP-binding protein CcmA [Actinomycetes bacterium]